MTVRVRLLWSIPRYLERDGDGFEWSERGSQFSLVEAVELARRWGGFLEIPKSRTEVSR